MLIRSDRSNFQMSDCERFAQIAQEKRATVSESLRLLMSNSDSLRSLMINERFAQKKLTKIVIFGTFFFIKKN